MKDRSQPQELHTFTETITRDPRLSDSDQGEIVQIILADMEIIIQNEDGDPIEKFEYEDDIRSKTEDALDWAIDNF